MTSAAQLTGADIATYALQYRGRVPYRWAGFLPSTGWDCSGFVGYVLGSHFRFRLPLGFTWSGKVHPPVASSYKAWSQATTVPRSACQTGDLCCWLTHIGIATSNTQMISALNVQLGTTVSTIDQSGPPGEPLSIRRINTLAAGMDVAQGSLSGCPATLILFPWLITRGVVARWRKPKSSR